MSWNNEVRNWNGKLYKALQGNKSCHGGNFEWDLPKDGKPGDWTPVIKNVEMCKRGYHLTTHYAHWSEYVYNIFVYEAEGNIVKFDGYDKVVCTSVRLLRLVENPFSEDNLGIKNSGILEIIILAIIIQDVLILDLGILDIFVQEVDLVGCLITLFPKT